MRYRTKLLLLFLLSAVFTTSLTVVIMEKQRWDLLFEQRQSKLKTLVATTASLLPGDLLQQIQDRKDEDSPAYRRLVALLKDTRNANQRNDFHITYLYTLRNSATRPGKIEFVADAEESEQNKSHVGDVYTFKGGHTLHIEQLQVDVGFHTDAWGRWLSANAPIRDRSGQIVGAVGADLSADTITRNINHALIGGFIGMAVSFPLIICCALLLSGWVNRPLQALKGAVQAIGKGELATRVDLKSRDEFGEVAQAINTMAVGLQERERVMSAFARYVAQTVLDRVLKDDPTLLKGDRRRITVLFSDIRDFTTLAENRRPEDVVALLNDYFERMIEVVIRNQGWVDKFIGDGLMVTFGALEPDPRHEEHAVKTALEMQEELQKLCARWELEGRPTLRIGIGIHSGEAIVGTIGSTDRVEFTALGDTVNLASRLETASKTLHVGIVISEATYRAVPGLFQTTDRGSLQVKGRAAEVQVYSVEGFQPSRKAA